MSSHDFRIPDLITKKKNGGSLTPKEIRFFITGVVNGEVKECKHCCRKANDEQGKREREQLREKDTFICFQCPQPLVHFLNVHHY